MHRLLLPSFLLLLAGSAASVSAQGDLARYRDKNRLLLVFAPSASDARWAHQGALLAGSKAQFADRDLLRFNVFERGPEAAALRARYHVHPGSFRVLLVGKDGHVAASDAAPVALSTLMGRIDRMPMRRNEMEMKRRGQGGGR